MKSITSILALLIMFMGLSSYAIAGSNSSCDNSMIYLNNFTRQNMVIDGVTLNDGSKVKNLAPNLIIPAQNKVAASVMPNSLGQALGTINLHFDKNNKAITLNYSFVQEANSCIADAKISVQGTSLAGWHISYQNGNPAHINFNRYNKRKYSSFYIGPE